MVPYQKDFYKKQIILVLYFKLLHLLKKNEKTFIINHLPLWQTLSLTKLL